MQDGKNIKENGDIIWCYRGLLHREDGPAVEFIDGYTAWYKEGLLHREDGPAVIRGNGEKEWFMKGLRVKEDEINQLTMKKRLNSKLQTTLIPKMTFKRSKI